MATQDPPNSDATELEHQSGLGSLVRQESVSFSLDSGTDDDTQNLSHDYVRQAISDEERVAFVQVVGGPGAGRTYVLDDGETVLGRSRRCGLWLEDTNISRRHASIRRLADRTFHLSDMGSTNGTLLNGRPLVGGSVPLQDGDQIRLGPTTQLLFLMRSRLEHECLAQLYQNATRDSLTGVLNKRALGERLTQEFAYARRHGVPLSVVLFDVDRFKAINDTYGHTPAGDDVLVTVAGTINRAVRAEDAFGRFGGEEFVLVLRETTQTVALKLADRLRQVVQNTAILTRDLAGQPLNLSVTVSAGVATATDVTDDETPQSLLSTADRLLLLAKQDGRNRVAGLADLPEEDSSVNTRRTTHSGTAAPRLGELLVAMGLVNEEMIWAAREHQKSVPGAGSLGQILIAMKVCTPEQIRLALEEQATSRSVPPLQSERSGGEDHLVRRLRSVGERPSAGDTPRRRKSDSADSLDGPQH